MKRNSVFNGRRILDVICKEAFWAQSGMLAPHAVVCLNRLLTQGCSAESTRGSEVINYVIIGNPKKSDEQRALSNIPYIKLLILTLHKLLVIMRHHVCATQGSIKPVFTTNAKPAETARVLM